MSIGTVSIHSGDFRPAAGGLVYWRSPAGRWWSVASIGSSLFDLAYRGLYALDHSPVSGMPAPGDILLVELEDGRDFRVRVGKLREWKADRTPVFREAWDETPL